MTQWFVDFVIIVFVSVFSVLLSFKYALLIFFVILSCYLYVDPAF